MAYVQTNITAVANAQEQKKNTGNVFWQYGKYLLIFIIFNALMLFGALYRI